MSEIIGAILAGGLGTRLRSVVSDRPKVLASVRGRPFLAYLLDQLVEAGIERVVLLTGYRSDQVRETFGDSYRGIALDYSVESIPLGTAGALQLALPKLERNKTASARRVLLLNGDSYCAAALRSFCTFHERESADASLVLTHVSDTSRFGTVEMGDDDRVERFVEKMPTAKAGWINAGIYLINRPLVDEIPAGRPASIEREMFPLWLHSRKLCGFHSAGRFLDIGTPESYEAAAEFFSRKAA